MTERNDKLYLNVELDDGTDEEMEIPSTFEVCDYCRGKGRCVNPSIDGHGLSQSDFDEDPDFRDDYFSGVYDINCPECKGKRVILQPDEDKPGWTPQMKAALESWHNWQAEIAWERRMQSQGIYY